MLSGSARSSMDRASDYGSEGWGFDSLRARRSRHLPDQGLPCGHSLVTKLPAMGRRARVMISQSSEG